VFILDTNVISESMRQVPEDKVARSLHRQPSRMLYTTSISQAEMLCGAEALPSGKRRTGILESD
jgi:predicted nucleic acid-binding protein